MEIKYTIAFLNKWRKYPWQRNIYINALYKYILESSTPRWFSLLVLYTCARVIGHIRQRANIFFDAAGGGGFVIQVWMNTTTPSIFSLPPPPPFTVNGSCKLSRRSFCANSSLLTCPPPVHADIYCLSISRYIRKYHFIVPLTVYNVYVNP